MTCRHYVDFAFYLSAWGGTAITEETFREYEKRARFEIDKRTFNRVRYAIENDPDFVVPDEIKMAVCAVMDSLYEIDTNGAPVQSETVGKHNVHYAGIKSTDEKIQNAIRYHLGGTAWTYTGMGKGY